MSDAKRILEYAQKETVNYLTTLKGAVELESLTYGDKATVDKCGEYFQKLFKGIGFEITVLPQTGCGDHFIGEYGAGKEAVLIVGHYDTVFPIGTLKTMPWKIEDGKVYGPGALDMKGGIVLAYYAIKCLQELGIPINKKIKVFLNSDEEAGSITSSKPIMEEARKCNYVLVPEPGTAEPGHVKHSRFGRAVYRIYTHGKSSHSGGAPKAAISAITELAYLVQALNAMTNHDKGLTVSPTYITAGIDSTAMIPGEGCVTVDVRSATKEGMDRVTKVIESLKPTVEGMRLEITGGVEKPIFEFNAVNKPLFAKAQEAGKDFGLEVTGHISGGGSDANFTSSIGTPTLDGLGITGYLHHNPGEHAIIEHIPYRMALLSRLIQIL